MSSIDDYSDHATAYLQVADGIFSVDNDPAV